MSPTPGIVTDETELADFVRDRGPHCLIVARHGETDWNAEGRLQGQRDVSLNERGRSQALAAAQLLRYTPLVHIYSSTLERARKTAGSIIERNTGRPEVAYSDLLKETTLGILEGEFIDHQTTANLTRHYQNFCDDEINYRVPDGENLRDVFARVERFFTDQRQLLEGQGVHLIVGHRNVNKMILKFLLGLSFEEGFQVEHEHQRIYFYFGPLKELWSCRVGDTRLRFTQGYATTTGSSCA